MDLSERRGQEAPSAVADLAPDAVPDNDAGTTLRDVLVANYMRLQRRLVRYLGCSELASDCLHDAWLRLGEFGAPAGVQSPQAYVYRVACNAAMDRLRRTHFSQHVDEAELEHQADPAPGPDRIVELRSDLAAVERAMQRLPRRHHAVLVALRIEEKTRQEVADGYRVSLTSVDTMLRQALDHCAQETGMAVAGGISGTRRGFSQRWRAEVDAAEAVAMACRHQRNDARQHRAA